jgi:hypothetical protein
MSDHILTAILTFSLLIGGTAAIGTEMFNNRAPQAAAPAVVTLAPVTVVAHRQAALEIVTLPAVTVTGHRSPLTWVASETKASEPIRVQ